MNQRDKMIQRNKIARLLEPSCRIHRNCIRLEFPQSKQHFMDICSKAYDLWIQGHSFYTEAKLGMKARADLLDLDDKIVWESVFSETLASLENKKKIWKEYDINVEVIV